MFPGRVIENQFGRCFVVEWEYPSDHQHGALRLSDALTLDQRGLSCIVRQSAAVDLPRNPVFLDTETTGLSGGTGTYAFLIALGSFEGDRFIVRQYLMRDYDEEPALLEAVATQLATHDAVVSFNGKSFDLPLIETRYLASRMPRPSIPSLHLDLLFPSRRLWRGWLESCSLGSLERAILGHRRHDDLPSWMIPSIFFQFVRERDPRLMSGILEHNVHDVLSLATLTGWLTGAFSEPGQRIREGHVLIRIATLYESLGWMDLAIACLQPVLSDASANGAALRSEAAFRIARMSSRIGAFQDTEPLWHIAAEHPGDRGIDALIAWAKILEHELRNYRDARAVVERALVRVQILAVRQPDSLWYSSQHAALEHRLARLIRKEGHWRTGTAQEPTRRAS